MTSGMLVRIHDSCDSISRVMAVFRRWRLKVHTLAITRTEQPGASRLIVVFEGEQSPAVRQQLLMLRDVIDVNDAPAALQERLIAAGLTSTLSE